MTPLLDDAFLRRLETLRRLAQKNVRGRDAGIHRSISHGSGMEFMDYRKYQPGDDFRYVDWNVYSRTGTLFIKRFHGEQGQVCYILLDTSRSMGFGRPDKFFYARKIAAALGYLSLAGQDQVAVAGFDAAPGPITTPERGRDVYLSILDFLSGLTPRGQTDVNAALSDFAAAGHSPGQVMVVSDLLDPAGYEPGLRALVYAKFSPCLIQVLAQEELSPELRGRVSLRDSETQRQMPVWAGKKIRRAYADKMAAYLEGIRSFCRGLGIGYHLALTHTPFEDFFLGYLNTRQQLDRGG